MLSHVILGCNDLVRVEAFFDQVLGLLGARQAMKSERAILWRPADGGSGIAVCLPHDRQSATHGNGTMVGLTAASIDDLRRIHETALALGGTCEGPPGERRPGTFAAYFRDLDGNKFGVFHVPPAT